MVLGAEDGVPNPECQGAARVVRPLEKALVMTGFLAGPIARGVYPLKFLLCIAHQRPPSLDLILFKRKLGKSPTFLNKWLAYQNFLNL